MIDDEQAAAAGLERLSEARPRDSLSFAPERDGMLRLEAHLSACSYRPHRHDTYAIGLTLRGVQQYRYRGTRRDSLPGEAVVLHPDEIHDGQAGTDSGLEYRMIYVDPAGVAEALGSRARHLPFVPEGHTKDPRLVAALARALGDLGRGLDPLEADEVIGEIAEALLALDPCARSRSASRTGRPSEALERARACLKADPLADWSSADLERETGLDRFEMARGFRRLYGTSPHRYLVLRRLERARDMMTDPAASLAEIAVAARFADQAHFTRHFRSAFGLTPGAWRALVV